MGGRERAHPGSGDRRPPGAEHQGREVRVDLVDESGGEERPRQPGAALDEDVGDLAEKSQRLGGIAGGQVSEPAVGAAHRRVRGHGAQPHHRPEGLAGGGPAVVGAGGQRGVVGAQRSGTDDEGVDLLSSGVGVAARNRPGDPLARPVRSRYPAVQTRRVLPGDEGAAVVLTVEPRPQRAAAGGAHLVVVGSCHLDPLAPQGPGSAGRHRIGVGHRVDHAGEPGGDDAGGARTGAPVVVTRLEGDHDRPTARAVPGGVQRHHLGVPSARGLGRADAHDLSGGVEHHRTDRRVGGAHPQRGGGHGDSPGQGVPLATTVGGVGPARR